jgi:hypothetical protein
MDFMRVHTPDKQSTAGSKRPEAPPPKDGPLAMYPQTKSTIFLIFQRLWRLTFCCFAVNASFGKRYQDSGRNTSALQSSVEKNGLWNFMGKILMKNVQYKKKLTGVNLLEKRHGKTRTHNLAGL